VEEDRPLLEHSPSLNGSLKTLNNSDEESYGSIAYGTTRTIEDDVLPETSTLGRTISWPSAYIIVISRVIGSGIFATPGVIFKSVGSVGLSLSLWVLGAVIAACGLAVTLEYGCMLPRSGGEKGTSFPIPETACLAGLKPSFGAVLSLVRYD
jgi:amino acid permease